MSLLFKIVPWLVAGLGIALYAPAPDGLKIFAIEALLWALGGMIGLVFLFAWFRPKNLVYGESGHRAEPEAIGELKAEELALPAQVGSEVTSALSQEKA